jgi:NEMP family
MYYFPFNIFGLGFIGRFWRRRFPSKRKLLTKEEFEEQGRLETEKALKELRDFVRSPKIDQWKVKIHQKIHLNSN